jgi:hypothetical protein
LKVNDENSRIRIQDPDPEPLVRGMDPRIRIHQNVMDPEHWLKRRVADGHEDDRKLMVVLSDRREGFL